MPNSKAFVPNISIFGKWKQDLKNMLGVIVQTPRDRQMGNDPKQVMQLNTWPIISLDLLT